MEDNDGRGRSRRSFLVAASGGLASAAATSGCLRLDQQEETGTTVERGETNPTTNAGRPTDAPTTTEATGTGGTATSTVPGSVERTLELTTRRVETFDPVDATQAAKSVVTQVFDGLLAHPNGEASVERNLAASISVSADYRTYEFTLKEDVSFHDGSKLTAEDVVYSVERLAASPNSRRSEFVLEDGLNVEHERDDQGEYVPGSMAIEAADDDTIRLRLAQPFAPALDVLASTRCSVVPRGSAGDIDVMPTGTLVDDDTTAVSTSASYDAFASAPVGTGAFAFDAWEQGSTVRVTRFEDHHAGAPTVGAVRWTVVGSGEESYQRAMEGAVDVFEIPRSSYDASKVDVEGTDDLGRRHGTYGPMANGETANYVEVPTLNTFYVGFNCERVPKAVREAVAYGIDQRAVVDEVFEGRAKAAYHVTPPATYPGGPPGYDDHATAAYPYGIGEARLDDARATMEAAGYGESNPFELTLTVYPSARWEAVGEVFAEQLAAAHVDVTVDVVEFRTLFGRATRGEIDAHTLGWFLDWPAPNNVLGRVVPSRTDTDGSGQPTGFPLDWDADDGGASTAAERVEEAWATVRDNPEPSTNAKEERNRAYNTIEEGLWTDVPMLPMYHATTTRFWYDHADVPRFGGLGAHRQAFDDVVVAERD